MKAGAAAHPVAAIVAVPVTTGASVSSVQVIVCTKTLLKLPHASIYCQLLVWVKSQSTLVAVEVCGYPLASVGAAAQLSVTVGSMKAGAVAHPVAAMVACPVTKGASVSSVQVIVCTKTLLKLPHASIYCQLLVWVKSQSTLVAVEVCGYPLASVGAAAQLSVTVGSMKAGAVAHPVAAMVACPVTKGASVSSVQVIVCTKTLLKLPHASIYCQLLVWVKSQSTLVAVEVCGYPLASVGAAAQLSVTVGSMKAGAVAHPVAAMVACPVTKGASVSS